MHRFNCLLFTALLGAAGLTTGCDQPYDGEEDRGAWTPSGKADAMESCFVDGEPICGDMAPGGCFCDDLCEYFGDCCADKTMACPDNECEAIGGSCLEGFIASCGDGLALSDASCGAGPIETTCCAPAPNACESAGGTCIEGFVAACPGGGAASADSCGDTPIETTCCLPPVENPCEAAGGTCVAGFTNCGATASPTADSCGQTPIETTCCIPD